ncbi:related to TIP41-negatively regulates the TOR signaling pathway [Sporisorium reilianum SRZ2]|uniref:Related to TIP41-negatively regulates the TOR signaling pathway n=1 Tax=Sporisorium reilianum (strain SRZ2) TaxID=999809 RepID=E6ZU14_SPORE|nr:related to TIP41-negatively regulates the TOR signaling pathway [Sporisorium reilianum SRZ2]
MSGSTTTWSHSTSRPGAGSSSAPTPTSTAPSLQPTTRGIDLGGWSVRVTSGPIGSSAEMDALGDILGIPPPEMAFPHNSLVLQHAASGFSLCFDAVRTLRSVEGVIAANRLYGIDCRDSPSASGKSGGLGAKPKAKGSIKVAYAKEWGKSRTDFVAPAAAAAAAEAATGEAAGTSSSHFGSSTDITAAKDYDWTYSTTWPGSIGDIAPQPLLPTQSTPTVASGLRPLVSPSSVNKDWFVSGTDPAHDRIPVERLGPSSGEPILFYDDVVLYEDELADNGSSIVNVKVRVMPSGFLVLQRFFLRVDDVVFRVFDTRLYCQFEASPVPRSVGTTQGATALPTSLAQLNLGAPRTAAKPKDADVVMSPTDDDDDDDEATFTPRLIRECSGSSASYALVRSHLPAYKPHDLSPLTDVNWVYSTLTKISRSQQAAYHAKVASGAQLPSLSHRDASAGAKFVSPTSATAATGRYVPGAVGATGFPGARPGERIDLSPARAPATGGAAQIAGQLDDAAATGGDEDVSWPGDGATVHIALLKARR